jgi:hypothetical protein
MVVLTKRAHLTLKLIWFTEKRNPRRPSVRGRFRDPEKRTVVWGSRILDFDKIPAAVWRTRLPRTRAARALPCTERYNTNTRCGSNGPLPAPRKPFFWRGLHSRLIAAVQSLLCATMGGRASLPVPAAVVPARHVADRTGSVVPAHPHLGHHYALWLREGVRCGWTGGDRGAVLGRSARGACSHPGRLGRRWVEQLG